MRGECAAATPRGSSARTTVGFNNSPVEHAEVSDVDPYELLVRWYLRLNGYLGIENFVVHEPTEGGNRPGAEMDVLAVRFPYSREVPDFPIENDLNLLDEEATRDGLIDFVIAEVKGGQRGGLNRVWRRPSDDVKVDRVSYLLRWLGPLDDEQVLHDVATDLQAAHRAQYGKFLFRLVLFANKRGSNSAAQQVTFRDIADFVVRVRAPSWQDHGLGVRSAHDQWPTLIKTIWEVADPRTTGSAADKIDQILTVISAARKTQQQVRAETTGEIARVAGVGRIGGRLVRHFHADPCASTCAHSFRFRGRRFHAPRDGATKLRQRNKMFCFLRNGCRHGLGTAH